MTIDELLSKDSSIYRFHGVRSATLDRLINQSVDGQIVLWGRVEDEDGDADYKQGVGELSTTRWQDVEMSCNEFVDDGGLVFVLDPLVDEPQEARHETDRREWLIEASEWRVIGALRPVFDADEELVEFEALSLEEIIEM